MDTASRVPNGMTRSLLAFVVSTLMAVPTAGALASAQVEVDVTSADATVPILDRDDYTVVCPWGDVTLSVSRHAAAPASVHLSGPRFTKLLTGTALGDLLAHPSALTEVHFACASTTAVAWVIQARPNAQGAVELSQRRVIIALDGETHGGDEKIILSPAEYLQRF